MLVQHDKRENITIQLYQSSHRHFIGNKGIHRQSPGDKSMQLPEWKEPVYDNTLTIKLPQHTTPCLLLIKLSAQKSDLQCPL